MKKPEHSLQITIRTTNPAYIKNIMSRLHDIIPVEIRDLDVIIDYSVKCRGGTLEIEEES